MTRKQQGLGRAELLWTVALVAFVVVLIVNTLQAEVARAKHRMCQDSLTYLSAQIHINLEGRQLTSFEQLEEYYSGPGVSADFMSNSSSSTLSSLISDDIYVPEDPWGQAFVLHKASASELWILSGGESGEYPTLPFTKSSLAKRVHLPYYSN